MENWNEIVEQSRYTIHAIEVDNGLYPSQLRRWLSGAIKPTAKSLQKIEGIMSNLIKEKQIEYSPIWGYATQEQIEKLKGYLTEIERERIMKQIEKQTKLKGKVR